MRSISAQQKIPAEFYLRNPSTSYGRLLEKSELTEDRDLKALGIALHQRLIGGDDVVVSSEIAEIFLPPLVERLKRRFYRLPDQHLIEEQAGQALLNYLRRPESFDASRGALLVFLKVDASGNLLDLIRAERRKKAVELPLACAEYVISGRYDGPDWDLIQSELPPALERLKARLIDERERRLLDLMAEGERSTERFAAELGIFHLEQQEMEREVKRHKDRLKKKLQRHLERYDRTWLESVLRKRQGNRKQDDE